jgi:hypothetical protein
MYNGQYAKGIVHLVVFAILVSLASDVNGIFGLFVAGWIVYQAIDANHTARARLAGTPLPNPFGLNDLGERLGFGKSWPASAPYTPPPTDPGPPPTGTYAPPPPYTPPAANWGAPAEGYNYYSAPPVPPVPPVPPYGSSYPNGDPTQPPFVPQNRMPTGAIWLIGLGAFFLIANTGLFRGFPARYFTPFLLIGFAVWLFVRKMTSYGTLEDDGTPMYRMRVFNALRGPIWIALVGIMFLLHDFNILSWGHSWPLFIIVAGLMTILQRAAFNNAAFAGYPYQQPTPPAPPPATSTSIVPVTPHETDRDTNQEGR